MTLKFIKYIFFCLLIAIIGCISETTPLNKKEKKLIGNWMKAMNNGQMQGWYMEFNKNRTGVMGPIVNVNNKVGMPPLLSFTIDDWRIQNDTLSFMIKTQSSFAAKDSEGKIIEQNKKPTYAYYIVWEITDSEIKLEDLVGGYPDMKERLKKCTKVELLNK